MFHQVKRAIEPSLLLQEVLYCWNDIACSLAEKPRTRNMQISKYFEFTYNKLALMGVEPTNNLAERSIRPAVQARKISYCTRSDKGQILRARLLNVWQSCRMQRRNPLDFFRQSIHAHRHRLPMPS